jgi:hypothetical protein
MMSDKPVNKRKPVAPIKSITTSRAEIEVLDVKDMTIDIENRCSLLFERLNYKSCPKLGGCYKNSCDELVGMHRQGFVREMYKLLSVNPTSTTESRFSTLVNYLRWLDSRPEAPSNQDYLSWELIDSFMDFCALQVKQGTLSKSRWGRYRVDISWLLKQLGRSSEARNLPQIKGILKTSQGYKSLNIETELKPVAKLLFKAYGEFLEHYNKGTLPERHPIYDKEMIDKESERLGLSFRSRLSQHASAKRILHKAHPNNNIVEIAIMICYMFTGMNTAPLADMKISDVNFKEVQGGKYILDSVKGRANYQDQDNGLGFSKHAKEFMSSWLKTATDMASGNTDAPLFPYVKRDGQIVTFTSQNMSPHAGINKLLNRHGLPNINPSIFRKTKLDTIFKVTESVYLVSMSANNSIEVTARTYVNGTQREHESNLGAAVDAKFEHAKGTDINLAVETAKFKFADVLDDYEYQRLRAGQNREHESRTPTGVRCNNNTKGSAEIITKALSRLGIESGEGEALCTDFLGCFECEHHALVAETTDIWLMLSFKETLLQLQQTPAINSTPKKKYMKILNTIESILTKFKTKSKQDYMLAEEKIKESSHPLYANAYSLNDLLEVFS